MSSLAKTRAARRRPNKAVHESSNRGRIDLICIIARWNFLLPVAKKNNNAAKFTVSLKQNNSEGFIGAP